MAAHEHVMRSCGGLVAVRHFSNMNKISKEKEAVSDMWAALIRVTFRGRAT
jgi:hypothetical protein